ncbi:MAG: alpha/beta hydrolase, partial [Nocardioidaceae bacterium]|nr:alpha/beta hydrolase [Nocardioidaceae bacterium]
MATGRRAAASWAVLVLGCVVVAAGAGLGVRHLAVEGLTATALLGLAILAGGLVLAGWAAVRAALGVRRRWWPLVIPAQLLVLALALWIVGQATMAAFPARPALGARTPADVGLAFRDVSLPAADGVRLAGWYVASRNGAAVVALHGAGSTRTAVLDQAAVLARHGYGVLLLDARGHGASSGRGMDFGWWGEADVRGAVDWVLVQPDVTVDRVGLVGLSMGGEEAIGAAGADPRVGAVVAEGATNRVSADKAWLAVYGWRGQLQEGLEWATYAVTDLLTPAPRPPSLRSSVVAATTRSEPTRFLLITAGHRVDERHAADRLAAVAPDLVEVWTVAAASHTRGLATDPAGW